MVVLLVIVVPIAVLFAVALFWDARTRRATGRVPKIGTPARASLAEALFEGSPEGILCNAEERPHGGANYGDLGPK